MRKKRSMLVILVAGLILLGGIIMVTMQTQQEQDLRQQAAPLACPVAQASCVWDPHPNATQYTVEVIEKGSPDKMITSQVVNHPQTRITFPASEGKTYECRVSAQNTCGQGPFSSTEYTCPIGDTPTPTVTPTGTLTPTLSPTPTVTPTNSPSPTGTLTPTATPTNCPVPDQVLNVRVECPFCDL